MVDFSRFESPPPCTCGDRSWQRFYEDTYPSGRRVEKFECGSCGREGRKFSRQGATIYAGAMRRNSNRGEAGT